jgi:hypothetical protein
VNYCAKIKYTHNIENYEVGEQTINYSVEVDGTERGTFYNKVNLLHKDVFAISKMFPADKREHWNIELLSANHTIPPHTDSEIKTAINLYLEGDICDTVFYELATETPNSYKLETQTNGSIFEDEENLKEVKRFTALPGEIWLIDVSVPHAVVHRNKKFSKEIINRKAIQLHTTVYSYDEVYDMLNETGALE